MTSQRDLERALDTFFAVGADEVADRVIDDALLTIDSTPQRRARRVPWRFPDMSSSMKLATVAAAVVLAVGGAAWMLGRSSSGGVGSGTSPTVSPSASAPASPEASMPRTFTSDKYGFSVRIPDFWRQRPGMTIWSPPEWKAAHGPQGDTGEISDDEPFDVLYPLLVDGANAFRAASAALPDGAVVDDWISEYITFSDIAECAPPRTTLERVMIGGQPGRLRGICGVATEIEATVVVDQRVYVFTLFLEPETTADPTNGRALFDAFASTIQLHPEDAQGPSPSPSPSRS